MQEMAAGDEAGRRVSAIIFDLDDTLVPTSEIDRAAITSAVELAISLSAAADLEVTAAAFKELLKSEPFPPEDQPEVSVAAWRTSLWERALKPDAPEGAAQQVFERWASERLRNFQFPDEVRGVIGRLEEAGFKMVIVTNGHTDVQRPKVEACNAAALFGDRIIISGEQPEWKPHPSIFVTACKMLGAKAAETVMVGDALGTDIQGGINANLAATVWIHGTKDPVPPAGSPEPTIAIQTVLDLEAALQRLNGSVS